MPAPKSTALPGASASPAPVAIPVALEALWATSQMNPRQIAYNEVVAFRKRGALDVDALREAFNRLVSRHEVWHSVVGVLAARPVLIRQPPARFALDLVDLSELDPGAAERQAVRLVADAARVPYDLARGPLLRPLLLRFPVEEHRLYLALHHMTFDGISLYRTILPELVALYTAVRDGGEADPLDPPRADYGDYARWEQEWMSTGRAERRLEYWRRALTPPPPSGLPTDEPRSETPQHRGGTLAVSAPQVSVARLHAVADTVGASLFQVCGAVWAALLHHFSGETDIVFGAPADLRRRSAFEAIVGYCLSPVVLRIEVGDDPTFTELVIRVRNQLLDGLDHLIPFERIASDLASRGGADRQTVYDTLLVLEPSVPTSDPDWSLHLMDSELGNAVGASKVDLELQLDEHPDGSITGRLIYDRDLFRRATVVRLAAAWQRIVEFVGTDPDARVSALALHDGTDTASLAEFNATSGQRTAGSIAQRFGEVAQHQPGRAALSVGATTLTYAELDQAALTGAGALRDVGLGEGDLIAVCLEPSVELVTAALACQYVGAAALLLNPANPPDTLRARARAAGCAGAIVVGPGGAGMSGSGLRTLDWTAAGRVRPPGPDVASPGDDAVPDGKSGSAQPCMVAPEPDGAGALAVLSRDTVDRLVGSLIAELGLGPGDTVLTLPEMLYESPWTELWPALLAGGRLLFAPPAVAVDGAQITKLIRAEGVTLLHATPTRWQALIDTGLRATRGLTALSGGGPLSQGLADHLRDRCRVVWSAYAPAVPGVYCTIGQVRDSGPVTVGRPLPDHRAYVVDTHDRPVPIGFVGELLLVGPLALFDIAAFGARAQEPGGRGPARRTGQRARWLRDGRLALISQPRGSAPAQPG